jgi:general secretion pathway protein D
VGLLARALQTVANTNILSRPNIQTLDNEEGKFLVGQNVPFVTGSYSTTASGTTSSSSVNPFQTFERRDVGLQLSVKPQISEGGTVRLAIYIEDSSVVAGTSGTDTVLNKRSFQTNVLVEDGSFVVISGLIQDQADETQDKVPILGDIPLLGRLFRYDKRDHTKTQTMVFLRPTIIRDEAAASDIALNRYDYIRTQVEETKQGSLLPLPNLSVEPLPPAPAPPRPKQAPHSAAPDQAPGAQSSPAAPLAPQSPAPANSVKPAGALASNAQASPYQLIQVSSVRDIGRGRQMQQQLRQAGFDSYWESVRTTDGDVVRIRVSVERTANTIADALSTLRRLGYDPVLVTP